MKKSIAFICAGILLTSNWTVLGQEKIIEAASADGTEHAESAVSIDLSQFANPLLGPGYQFYGISWGSSPADVELQLGTMKKTADQDANVERYQFPGEMQLMEQPTELYAEYENQGLRAIELRSQLSSQEETEELTQEVLAELGENYGKQSGEAEPEEGVKITYWEMPVEQKLTSIQVAQDVKENCLVLTLLCENRSEENMLTVSLKDLKDGEAYCYGQIPWGTSLKELEEMLGHALEPHAEVNTLKTYLIEGVTLLELEEPVQVELELVEDKLNMFSILRYETDEELREEYFQKAMAALRELYGEEADYVENQQMSSGRWWGEKKSTTLQIQNIKDENGCVRIGVAPVL